MSDTHDSHDAAPTASAGGKKRKGLTYAAIRSINTIKWFSNSVFGTEFRRETVDAQPKTELELKEYFRLQKDRIGYLKEIEDRWSELGHHRGDCEKFCKELGPYVDKEYLERELLLFENGTGIKERSEYTEEEIRAATYIVVFSKEKLAEEGIDPARVVKECLDNVPHCRRVAPDDERLLKYCTENKIADPSSIVDLAVEFWLDPKLPSTVKLYNRYAPPGMEIEEISAYGRGKYTAALSDTERVRDFFGKHGMHLKDTMTSSARMRPLVAELGVVAEAVQAIVKAEEEHLDFLGKMKGIHNSLDKVRDEINKGAKFLAQRVIFAHTYIFVKPKIYNYEKNCFEYPPIVPRPGEVGPGLDNHGMPLELIESGHEKFTVLLDLWSNDESIRKKPRTIADRKFIEEPLEKDGYGDILRSTNYINNEFDSFRDDFRDGRYHPLSRTIYDHIQPMGFNIGSVPDPAIPIFQVPLTPFHAYSRFKIPLFHRKTSIFGSYMFVPAKRAFAVVKTPFSYVANLWNTFRSRGSAVCMEQVKSDFKNIRSKGVLPSMTEVWHSKGEEAWSGTKWIMFDRTKNDYVVMPEVIRPTHLNPAFDLRGFDRSKKHQYYVDTPTNAFPNREFRHLGRKYYYETTAGIPRNPASAPHPVNPDPWISSRGIAKWIIYTTVSQTLELERARLSLKGEEYDYGIRWFGAAHFNKDPLGTDYPEEHYPKEDGGH